jgi:PAS domain S-box-containing protein
MDLSDKTKEELIIELMELHKSTKVLHDQYEKEISLLKQTEEKITKNSEIFRKSYLTSPDSININRLYDGMYVSINEGFTRITGYSEEDALGKTSVELNIWFNPDERTALVNELKAKGEVRNFEARFLSKSGTVINGLIAASLIDLEGVPHILSVIRDITFRKRAEEALAKEQFLINAIMNNITDHIYFKDLESRFVRINKSHALRFGFDNPDQAIGKTDFDFFSNEHAQQAFDDEQAIIRTGQMLSKVEKETHPDGPDTWVSTVKLPLRDIDGNIIGTFGISRDITERRVAEEALKQSEERFRAVAESANDAIITANSKGNIFGWNRGAEEVFGYKDSEIIGKSLRLIIPDHFLIQVIKSMKRIELWAEENASGKTVELNGLRKDGNIFPLELSLSKWETSEGKFFTGIIRDITIRKRTELENQIIYEITQGIATTSNLDELLKLIHHSLGKVVYAENCFVALHDQKTGLFSFPYFVDKFDSTPLPTSMRKSCSAYVFRSVKPLLYTEKIFNQLKEANEVELVGSASPSWIGIPLQTPSDVIGVLVLQHYENENVYSENDLKFLISIGSQIALAIERKKAEEEIKLKNELLQGINAEKDKFFSILAHDLRGPLSAFVAATQILTEDIQSMNMDDIKDITLSMKISATNIYSLLENLLEWSRLRRGGMDFVPEKLNLKNKIEDCIEVLSESAKKKEIEITVSIEDDLEVFADNHMFDSVIRNLISNAVKFTPFGGKVSVTADINSDLSIEIRISDSGIGMPPELKSKLFMINEKTSRNGTEGEQSTGLGLLL